MTKKPAHLSESAPAPAEPTNHRADAAQAFMASWLPRHAVSATAFKTADAEALLSAIDAAPSE